MIPMIPAYTLQTIWLAQDYHWQQTTPSNPVRQNNAMICKRIFSFISSCCSFSLKTGIGWGILCARWRRDG